MHILQIIPNLNLGGAERFVVDLSNELYNLNNKITIITFYEIDKENILLKSINSNIKVKFLSKKKGFDFRFFFKLKNEIIKINPDIIHSHLRALNYLFFSFNLNIPIVHTIHNSAEKETLNFYESIFRKYVFKYFKIHPITISEQSNNSFIKHYNSHLIKSTIIFNGRKQPTHSNNLSNVKREISAIKSKFGQNVKILINIARIEDQKNHIMLCNAINRVNDLGYNVVTLVLGGYRNKNSDKILSNLRKINNDKFIINGEVDHPTDYLFLTDYFILSSNYEGMPISLIESFSCNSIPISTPVGGIPEMIGTNGFLSKSTSEIDMAKCIIDAITIDEKEKLQILNKNKIKFESIFSIYSCAKNYNNYYKKIL